jgi:transcriptional regulator with XRE-family HTH domain
MAGARLRLAVCSGSICLELHGRNAMKLAQRVRAYRGEHKITQAQFASAVGKGSTWVVEIEKGADPKLSRDVRELAAVLGVTADEILAEFAE